MNKPVIKKIATRLIECGIEYFSYTFIWDDTFSYSIIASEEGMQRMCKECSWEITDGFTLRAKSIDNGYKE